jgi:hypothetical protein
MSSMVKIDQSTTCRKYLNNLFKSGSALGTQSTVPTGSYLKKSRLWLSGFENNEILKECPNLNKFQYDIDPHLGSHFQAGLFVKKAPIEAKFL